MRHACIAYKMQVLAYEFCPVRALLIILYVTANALKDKVIIVFSAVTISDKIVHNKNYFAIFMILFCKIFKKNIYIILKICIKNQSKLKYTCQPKCSKGQDCSTKCFKYYPRKKFNGFTCQQYWGRLGSERPDCEKVRGLPKSCMEDISRCDLIN